MQSLSCKVPQALPFLQGTFHPLNQGTCLQHVVDIPTRNWHKCSSVRVAANFLNVGADFFNNFLLSLLAVGRLSGIHFVNTNNQLFHTQCVSQKGMLTGLPILGDTRLNSPTLAATIRTAQSAGNVPVIMFLIKPVSWGIKDGHITLAGLKFPQGGINYDTTLMFSFQFIQDPGTPEGALSYLSSLLFKFFDGPFVDPTTSVD